MTQNGNVICAYIDGGKVAMNKRICPKCGSKEYSMILQGDSESKEPFWECSDCSFKNNQEDDKIDSFDYDQGYNLDEVYDQ